MSLQIHILIYCLPATSKVGHVNDLLLWSRMCAFHHIIQYEYAFHMSGEASSTPQ